MAEEESKELLEEGTVEQTKFSKKFEIPTEERFKNMEERIIPEGITCLRLHTFDLSNALNAFGDFLKSEAVKENIKEIVIIDCLTTTRNDSVMGRIAEAIVDGATFEKIELDETSYVNNPQLSDFGSRLYEAGKDCPELTLMYKGTTIVQGINILGLIEFVNLFPNTSIKIRTNELFSSPKLDELYSQFTEGCPWRKILVNKISE